MGYITYGQPKPCQGDGGSFCSKLSHSHHITWFKPQDGTTKSPITCCKQWFLFNCSEVIWSSVAASGFNEKQWAVVDYKKTSEKPLRCSKPLFRPPPQSPAANLTPWTGETLYRPLGMQLSRTAHGCLYAQPLSDGSHLAERDAGLGHSPRAGIHSQEDDLYGAFGIEVHVPIIGCSGVFKGIVDVAHWRAEAQKLQVCQKGICYGV